MKNDFLLRKIGIYTQIGVTLIFLITLAFFTWFPNNFVYINHGISLTSITYFYPWFLWVTLSINAIFFIVLIVNLFKIESYRFSIFSISIGYIFIVLISVLIGSLTITGYVGLIWYLSIFLLVVIVGNVLINLNLPERY